MQFVVDIESALEQAPSGPCRNLHQVCDRESHKPGNSYKKMKCRDRCYSNMIDFSILSQCTLLHVCNHQLQLFYPSL